MAHDIHTSPRRDYRQSVHPGGGECSFQVVVEETDLLVVARKDLSVEIGRFVHALRARIKAYITLNPTFATSLTPVAVPPSAPAIIRAMADAARICGVGPMAAVAGSVAQFTAEAFATVSPDILVENGGDLHMLSTRERTAAILSEPDSGARLGLVLPAKGFPLSLCASSATIGHSLSLGQGDLVVAKSANASLADAAATALCNQIQRADDLKRVTDTAMQWQQHGLSGIYAQCGKQIAVWGEMELAVLD